MWARLVSAGLGVWLMAAPALLDYAGRARTIDRIAGPLAAAFAVIAVWEVVRGLRWVELALGLALVMPWWAGTGDLAISLLNVITGLLLMGLAPLGGAVAGRYGGGWRALFRRDPAQTKMR